MNATISMEGLWSIVSSLTIKNKRWLAEKLREDLSPSVTGNKDEEILDGMVRSVNELKNGETFPMDKIWDQL